MSYHLNISNPACLTLGLNRGLDSGNPAADAHNLFEATDEDIFEAVMDVRGVQEADKTQVLGIYLISHWRRKARKGGIGQTLTPFTEEAERNTIVPLINS